MDYFNDSCSVASACAIGLFLTVLLLIAIRESLTEQHRYETDPDKRKKLSAQWHSVGGWLRGLLVVISWLVWQSVYVSVAALLLVSVVYNVSISIGRGHKWWYVGNTAKTDKLIRKLFWYINFDEAL